MSKITVAMIVHNEEQWVWYAIQSVLPYVSSISIINTGSIDKTAEIINSIRSSKIHLTNYHRVNSRELVELRNKQLQETHTEWFMLLDGDEVWPKKSIQELVAATQKKSVNGIVVKCIVPVGDLFHYQSVKAGKYSILGKIGHYNIRAYRKVYGYSWKGIYPLEAYTDTTGTPIQNKNSELFLLKNSYWHMTHLVRSSIDAHKKRKFEIGERKKVVFPEVFSVERPNIVPSPWVSFSTLEKIKAYAMTPLLYIKRRVLT